jgi:hypothetical protein
LESRLLVSIEGELMSGILWFIMGVNFASLVSSSSTDSGSLRSLSSKEMIFVGILGFVLYKVLEWWWS